jgi:hypothetical protein
MVVSLAIRGFGDGCPGGAAAAGFAQEDRQGGRFAGDEDRLASMGGGAERRGGIGEAGDGAHGVCRAGDGTGHSHIRANRINQ